MLRSLTIHFKLFVYVYWAALDIVGDCHNTGQSGNDVQMMDELWEQVGSWALVVADRYSATCRSLCQGWPNLLNIWLGTVGDQTQAFTVLKAASTVASCHSVLETRFGHVWPTAQLTLWSWTPPPLLGGEEAANRLTTHEFSNILRNPRGSLPWTHEPTTGPYPEPDQLSRLSKESDQVREPL
jgi:hypothetical protein